MSGEYEPRRHCIENTAAEHAPRIVIDKVGLPPKGLLDLSEKRRELLEALLREEGIAPPTQQRIRRRASGTAVPLSFAQERLWFLDQLSPRSVAYIIPSGLRLQGPVERVFVERSVNEIVARHESLRTTVALDGGRPFQVVHEHSTFTLPVLDLCALDGAVIDDELVRIAREQGRGPFDLEEGPLFRVLWLELGAEDHALLLTMHHIVSDAWSIGVFMRELWALYEAFAAGRSSPLEALPIQYGDFSLWQRDWFQGKLFDAQLVYWRDALRDSPPLLELPTDHPRPRIQSFQGGSLSLVLSPELSEGLRKLSRVENVSLFMTLLAAFDVLLYRYTGQADVVVGSPVANRVRSETERLIGFFVNTVVLRTDLSGNPTFQELLGRVREVTLGAYAHQDLPFEKLVEELRPERNLAYSPLFQVMFGLQTAPMDFSGARGFVSRPLRVQRGAAMFDLTLLMVDTEQGLRGTCEYGVDLFEGETIGRMMGHFERLLEEVVQDPDQRIGRIGFMREEERSRILEEWNETGVVYQGERTLDGLFREQAERTPDAVALVSEKGCVSYGELAGRASGLEAYLRGMGVGRESRVGICVERSVEMVVGLLGVLQAGAAYVPLDPGYPRERLEYMLEDSKVGVVLSTEAVARELGDLLAHGARTVLLDGKDGGGVERRGITQQSEAEGLAYVIYTSGSTGVPKGVMGTHGAAVNRLRWMWERYGFGEEEVCCQKTSLGFVDSVWEIFGSLLAGTKTVLIPEDLVKDVRGLIEVLADEGVSRIVLVPSLLRAVLDSGGKEIGERLKGLRYWTSSGEALGEELLNRFLRHLPHAVLLNLYGSSEVAGDATYSEAGREGLARSVSLGSPIANTEVYVLDELLGPVAEGVCGGVYVGGAGLSRGYVHGAELTAARFVPNALGEPGTRLYETGDRGRWRDGELLYEGRRDDQVKVRGYRVELEEVAAVLRGHPGVASAVVVARGNGSGESRLVGYVVGVGEGVPTERELYGYMRRKLPEYMIPSALVLMGALPLTPSGKLDRQALPAPDGRRPEMGRVYVAPRNAYEEVLAGIWEEVLGVSEVGVEDNFFELGGHSLLAMQVVSRVRDVLGVEVSLQRMFERATVGGMAEEVRKGGRAGMDRGMVRLPRDKPLPLSFAQQRLWFLDQLDPGSPVYNIASGVRLRGLVNLALVARSVDQIVARHESLRTRFGLLDGQPVQVVKRHEVFGMTVVDLCGLDEVARETELERIALEQARLPFDLAAGPLLRVVWSELSEQDHALLITMHHIVSDGWSVGIFMRELWALYEAFAAGEGSPLGELQIQYGDFSAWQRQHLQGEALEKEVSYWREVLQGAPPVLELPTDRPRPLVQSFKGASHRLALSRELTDRLQELSRREHVSLFMMLLAAFNVLLFRYTGQSDVVVGSPVANRARSEVDGLIGFFVNTLVLRTDLSHDPTFREVLRRVRAVTLGAYAHQDLPFEKLVEELHPGRSLSYSPLFQVMFGFQNTPLGLPTGGGLISQPLRVDRGAAMFDLTLMMVETAQGLRGSLEYRVDMFEAATIERMARHFFKLLEEVVRDSEQRIGRIGFIQGPERWQMLEDWNATAVGYDREATLHGLFEEQLARSPDAVVVEFEGECVSRRELDKRANQLAAYLQGFGIGPESRVGVCLERSVGMVVGLLGVLKAGAAYVPLDPQHPQQRLAYVLKDSGAKILLTQKGLLENLDAQGAARVCLDAEWSTVARESSSPSPSCAGAGDLAYVIYTSGSTGVPKGVEVSHRSVVNLLGAVGQRLGVAANDVLLAVTTLAFDIAALEVFLPLSAGARLVIVSQEMASDGKRLARMLADHGVTIMQATPATWHLLLDAGWQGRELHVLCGGEALPRELADRLLDRSSRLWNMYGPTETTIWSAMHLVEPAPSAVPIGGPLANTLFYVVDDHLELVAKGVSGELLIGGDGLARGYFHRPDLTAERFVPNPFRGHGERLYRTGDVTRYLPDGVVEFLGRNDHQVKIRGHRIELGEIEAVLEEHASVRRAVVVAAAAPNSARNGIRWHDQRLLAYVVVEAPQPDTPNELRSFLRDRLPEYMVPSGLTLLDGLPLTPNGKLDRLALLASKTSLIDEAQVVHPHTPMERLIAQIWQQVLGINDTVSVHDNFFDLGGHSLLSIQVVDQLDKRTGVRLNPRLLVLQSLAQLAATCEKRAGLGLEQAPGGLKARVVRLARRLIGR